MDKNGIRWYRPILLCCILLYPLSVMAEDVPIVKSEILETDEYLFAAEEEEVAEEPARIIEEQPVSGKISQEEHQALKERYEMLVKEKEQLQIDRDNVLMQIKRFSEERQDFQDQIDTIKRLSEENKMTRDEKETLQEQNIEYAVEIEKLKDEIDTLQLDLREAQLLTQKNTQLEKIKELNEKLAFSQKTKENLVEILKELESKMQEREAKANELNIGLSKKDDEIQRLGMQLDSIQGDYKDLSSENNYLKDKIEKMPREFAEMARDNLKLSRQTADMHYNLGVFYTQHKEYKRATLEFLKALDIRPEDASAHYNLGYLYAEHLVNQSKAVEHFKEYLRITKGKDKDADKAKKYILIWETYTRDEIK